MNTRAMNGEGNRREPPERVHGSIGALKYSIFLGQCSTECTGR